MFLHGGEVGLVHSSRLCSGPDGSLSAAVPHSGSAEDLRPPRPRWSFLQLQALLSVYAPSSTWSPSPFQSESFSLVPPLAPWLHSPALSSSIPVGNEISAVHTETRRSIPDMMRGDRGGGAASGECIGLRVGLRSFRLWPSTVSTGGIVVGKTWCRPPPFPSAAW